MKRKCLQHVVTFGGERMTRGEMIRRLRQTARDTGHPNPRLLVDRYLQGWEAGLTLADHAELWCQERGGEPPPRCTPEWTAMYEAWHSFAFRDFKEAVVPHNAGPA
jgi:hypothetical protein